MDSKKFGVRVSHLFMLICATSWPAVAARQDHRSVTWSCQMPNAGCQYGVIGCGYVYDDVSGDGVLVNEGGVTMKVTNLGSGEPWVARVDWPGTDTFEEPAAREADIRYLMVHPHENCGTHVIKFLGQAYLRSIPVYLPVYIVPALLVHRLNILKTPLPILQKTALALARSSLFLASFCSSCWLVTCSLHQATGICSPTTVALGTLPAGLAVLLEKKSRRMELALYCFSRAVESFALGVTGRQHDSGRTKGPPPAFPAALARLDIALFTAASAIIMHCYAQERDVFRSKYLNILDWVFGIPGGPRGYKLSSVPPTPGPSGRSLSANASPSPIHSQTSPPEPQLPNHSSSTPLPPLPLTREPSLRPRSLEAELDEVALSEQRPIPAVALHRTSSSLLSSESFPWKPESVELPVQAAAVAPLDVRDKMVPLTAGRGVGGSEGGDAFSFNARNPGLGKSLMEASVDEEGVVELEPSGA